MVRIQETNIANHCFITRYHSIVCFSCFSYISTTEGCGRDKSRPDVYLAVSERFGLRPDECLVYEDILRGIRTAGKAGFRTAAVYDSASAADWEAMKAAADIALGSFLS